MRLELDSGLSGIAGGGRAAPANPSTTAARNAGSVGIASPDSVQISGASSALSRLTADRDGRIRQLSAQVQGGTYQVPGAAISAALVRNALL